jgi:hypothetical protein
VEKETINNASPISYLAVKNLPVWMAGVQLDVQYYSGDIQTIFEIRYTSIIEFFYFSLEGDSPNCYLYSLHGEKILPAAAFIYCI